MRSPAPAVPAAEAAGRQALAAGDGVAAASVAVVAVARAAVVGLALTGLSVAGGSGEGGAAGMRNGGSARCVQVRLAADVAPGMEFDFTLDGTSYSAVRTRQPFTGCWCCC